MEFFKNGDKPSLMEVLDRKEKRQEFIAYLSEEFQDKTVLIFTLNIPGQIKNNEKIYELFVHGREEILEKLENLAIKILFTESKNLKTGPEFYLVSLSDPFFLKKQMIELEDSEIGRLYDIDIVNNEKFISREDLNISQRKCFICKKDAKICARSRAHSLEEMLSYIEKLMKKYLRRE